MNSTKRDLEVEKVTFWGVTFGGVLVWVQKGTETREEGSMGCILRATFRPCVISKFTETRGV